MWLCDRLTFRRPTAFSRLLRARLLFYLSRARSKRLRRTTMVLKYVKIRSYEKGLYFRDGEYMGLLDEGRFWFVDPFGKVRVDVVSQRTPWLVHEKLDMIV